MENGLIHIYMGEGKGKSTAAFGLALRCFGAGGNVQVLQFLKPNKSGEVQAILAMDDPRLSVLHFESEHDLVHDDPTELDLEYLNRDILKAYNYALQAVRSGTYDLLVFDEILWAYYFKFITLEDLMQLAHSKHENTEVVFTGRYAPDALCDVADYITTMEPTKHPYMRGISAREGIEY